MERTSSGASELSPYLAEAKDAKLVRTCDGCACLEIEPPATSYGYYLACCTDVDKPVTGLRRVVAAARVRPPFGIPAPVYCREKKTKGGAADGVPAGRDEIL